MQSQKISTIAFVNYLAHYIRNNPTKSPQEIARDGETVWRCMTESEKQPFRDIADCARRLKRTKSKRSKVSRKKEFKNETQAFSGR
ncbi:hypothetical protein PPYR_11855 [Photinus pyralis]|uniref:HMG box domain-containing protein n=1 Tax=Photinus pyralis TaxID=7054 RepID=A0A5N4ACH5_PHOPY|nr:hypothetical protein PPYR_11855 [Photinus pyralis]